MDLKELYQEIILDHGKNPRNKGKCDGYTNDAKAHNPLCGDKVHIYLKLNKEKEIASDLEKKYGEWAKRCGVLDWPIRVDDESTRKIYSMNKNEVGLDPNITPLEIEEERRYKRKPPNEDNITVRGMRYSK